MERAMKDSGIEWIGEIPQRWEIHPARYAFSEVKEKNTSGEIKKALQFKFGRIIAKKNFEADSDEYVADTITNYTIVTPNIIMINGLNLNYDLKSLRVAIVREKGVITSAYLALKPDEQIIYPEFANYLFKGYETKMAFHNMGAGIRLTLGFKEFKNQPVLIPPFAEQHLICEFLDRRCAEIDSVIAQTQKTIEEYKALKQSIITEAVTKGIRPNRPMKDSGVEWIGEIPEEWSISRLQFLIDHIESGTSVNAGQQAANKGEYGVLKTSCVSKNIFLPEENKAVNHDEYERVSCPVCDNTLIVSRMNTPDLVGATGYVEGDYPNLFLPDRLWQVHFISSINVKYYYYWEICKCVRNYYSSLAVGTSSSMQNISQDQFYHAYCPVASISEQSEIVSYLDEKCSEIENLIAAKQQLLTELETYKKSVIYEYVTGKKEVPVCQ